MTKRYDVVAVVGQYQDNQTGQMRPRFKNVGAVIESTDGKLNLLLDKTFNPAGLAEADRESILLNLFEPRQRPSEGQNQPPAGQSAPQPHSGSQGRTGPLDSAVSDFDDDIPF